MITLQSYTATTDAYGGEIQTWADLGQEWAMVLYGRGEERRQAAQEQGSKTAIFRVLDNSTTRSVRETDRIVFDGYVWDIKDISPNTPKRGEIEIAATTDRNPPEEEAES